MDFEGPYDRFESRFSRGAAGAQRGSYSRFLGDTGSGLGAFAGQMGSGFSMPQGTNGQEQEALTDSLDSLAMGQFGSSLGRLQSQVASAQQIGAAGLSALQGAQQAKAAAKLRARSANQAFTTGAISSGLSALGSIYGGLKNRQPPGLQKSGISAIRKT